MTNALPQIGQFLRDKANNGWRLYHVSDVFAGSGQYPGMLLDWEDDGKLRGQVFTTRDWQQRWEVVKVPADHIALVGGRSVWKDPNK